MKKRKAGFMSVVFIALICLSTGCGRDTKRAENIEDFYQQVNGDWIDSVVLEEGNFYYNTTKEQEEKVCKELNKYLQELTVKAEQGKTLTEEEEKEVLLYQQAEDWEWRNEISKKPLEHWLKKIEAVESKEDLVQLLKEDKFAYFNTLFSFYVKKDGSTGKYETYVVPSGISGQEGMFTEDQFVSYQKFLEKEVSLAGYSKEAAEDITKNALKIEKVLQVLVSSGAEDYSKYANKGMTSVLDNLPLEEIAKEQGYLENRMVLVCSGSHLKFLQELFTSENIPIIKDYLITSTIVRSAPYLDEAMAQQYEAARNAIVGGEGENYKEYAGCKLVSGLMEDSLAAYYMQESVGSDMEKEIREMSEEIRTVFRKNITKAQWLEESTRKYALKKLDAMQVFVGLPKQCHDYQKVTVTSKEDGGNLLDNVLEFYRSEKEFQRQFLLEENQDSYYFHPLEVNAEYAVSHNAFAIPAALIGFAQCDKDSTYEEKLASMGFTIAHEISHGFDGIGSQYTAEGIYQNWWKQEDISAYRERINQVKHYFDGMQVETYTLSGEMVMNEAYADLSAMSVCMSLLSEKKDSDYRDFFEAYAKSYRCVMTPQWMEYLIVNDSHLPDKVRVNQVVNQMDEFYDTYRIDPDSPMYVSPEQRIHVWE